MARRLMMACLGFAVLAAGVAVGPAAASASAHRQNTSATAAVTAPPVAIAVEGKDHALWVQAPQLGSGWHSLGGTLIAPPAVVAMPSSTGSTPLEPLFIAVGTNDGLWARTLTTGWQSLGGDLCYGVGAALYNAALTVACQGLYNRLTTYNTADLTGCLGVPCFITGATDLGGVLTAAPAVTPFGSYIVLGTQNRVYISDGNSADGFTATPWRCTGQPGASGYVPAAGETTVFACEGTNHALWEASTYDVGRYWTGAVSLGGVLIGGPAVVATTSVTEFFAVGTNHAIWERTASSGWHSLGGYVLGGVAAVALS